MNKLNFGCGSIQPEGWVNVDELPEFGATNLLSPQFTEPFQFDMIVAHCSLQMNDFNDIPDLLRELHRLLKIGGVLRISLPDIEEGFRQYAAGNINWFPNGEQDIHIRFSAWLTWYSTTKTLLTSQALERLLIDAGFTLVKRVGFKDSWLSDKEITDLDTRENECYFMEARK